MRRTAAFSLGFALALPAAASAQHPTAGLRVGDTVQVHPHHEPSQKGEFAGISNGQVGVVRSGRQDTLFVPLTSLKRVERLQGRSSRAGTFLKGVAFGAIVGGVFGAFIGAASWDPDEYFFSTRSEEAAFGAVVVSVPGAVIGGLIGLGSSTDRWERVPLNTLRSVRLAPSPAGGARVGLSLSFR